MGDDFNDFAQGKTDEELHYEFDGARLHKPNGAGASEDNPTEGGADHGVSINDFRAYMPQHAYIFCPSRELWPATSVNARIPPIAITDAAGRPVLDAKGNPQKILANRWLDQHHPVEQMTWSPGEDILIRDRLILDGGWIDRPGCTTFNLYCPPSIIPGDARKTGRWLEHIRLVYPDDADHIANFLAHRVQRPAEKINHALVLGGAPGVGKDTLLEPVKPSIGPWNFAEVSPQQLCGRFNGFLKSVILRVNEARNLGDFDRFAFYDHMKAYTAAPQDVLRIDEKHLREYSIFNVCGVIITSNYKTNGLFLPADDRRHYVAWTSKTRADFSDDYWTGIYA